MGRRVAVPRGQPGWPRHQRGVAVERRPRLSPAGVASQRGSGGGGARACTLRQGPRIGDAGLDSLMAGWTEFDLNCAIWTIPEDRTKLHRHHRVPLSSVALKRLGPHEGPWGPSSLVSPGRQPRPLGDATMSLLLWRFGIPCVSHGMWSSFCDWYSATGIRREVVEAALAHLVKN